MKFGKLFQALTTVFANSVPYENNGSLELCIFMCMLRFVRLIITQKRKTCCYVDYDQAAVEDDAVQSAASLTWPGTTSSVQLESEACVKRCTRESVTYDDADRDTASSAPLIIRGRFYNNQFADNHAHPANWMHTAASRYVGVETSLSLFVFIF